MLSQAEANLLIALEKIFLDRNMKFPEPGTNTRHKLESVDGKEKFTLAIVRSDKSPLKCSYTELCKGSTVLLRVDTEQQIHTNPDGTDVPAPHIHIYREGYEDKYAYPLPDSFTNHQDLVKTLYDLLSYSNVINVHDVRITVQGGLFDEKGEAAS